MSNSNGEVVDCPVKEQNGVVSDPSVMLKMMDSNLDENGGISSETKQVLSVLEVMDSSTQMVDLCMMINILRSTKSSTMLKRIMEEGGWEKLFKWLQEARSQINKPLIMELLQLYKMLPVNVKLLKLNSCAKEIKQLIRCNDDRIARMAKVIVDDWMGKVMEKSSTGSDSSAKKSSSNHSQSHSHSSKSSKSNNDKTKISDDSSSSRDSQSLSQKLSADSKISTSVAIVPDFLSSGFNSDPVKTTETVTRPKTVKTLGSRFRSTGLELETNDSSVAKKKSSDSQSITSSSLNSISSAKKSSSVPQEKKGLNSSTVITSASTSTSTSVSNSTSSAMPQAVPSTASSMSTTTNSLATISSPPSSTANKTPKIKLIPPKPRAPEIFESSGFMDALGSTTDFLSGINRRKRKASQNSPTTLKPVPSSSSSLSSTVVVEPEASEEKSAPLVLSFYRETLEFNTSKDENKDGPSSPTAESERDTPMESNDVETNADNAKEENSESSIGKGSEASSDISSGPAAKKTKKSKSVTWADDLMLCSFFYFQLDETERVNVNKIVDFADSRKHEQEMERQMFQKRGVHDTMVAKRQWRKPPLISGLESSVQAGCNSVEKKVQMDRENSVLQIIYFDRNTIPDSSAEAEAEYWEVTEPKIIPLYDVTLGPEDPSASTPSNVQNQSEMNPNGQALPSVLSNLFGNISGPPSQMSPRTDYQGIPPQQQGPLQGMMPMHPSMQPYGNAAPPSLLALPQLQPVMNGNPMMGANPMMQQRQPLQRLPPSQPGMFGPPATSQPGMFGSPATSQPGMFGPPAGFQPMRQDFPRGPQPFQNGFDQDMRMRSSSEQDMRMRGSGSVAWREPLLDSGRGPFDSGRGAYNSGRGSFEAGRGAARDRVVCQQFMMGSCRFGSNCRNVHAR